MTLLETAQSKSKSFASYGPPRRSDDPLADAIFDLCGYLHEAFVANKVSFGGSHENFHESFKRKRREYVYHVKCSECGTDMEKVHVYKITYCKDCLKKHDAERKKIWRKKTQELSTACAGGKCGMIRVLDKEIPSGV